MLWIKVLLGLFIVGKNLCSEENFKIKAVDLLLNTNIDEGNASFSATAKISIDITESSASVKLKYRDLENFMIGQEFNLTKGSEFLEIKLRNGSFTKYSEHSIELSYEGNFQKDFIGSFTENDMKNYFLSLSFKTTPFYSICPFDDSDNKIDFDLTVTHQNIHHALSNHPISSVNTENGTSTTTFNKTFLSPSSIAIFVSNFLTIHNENLKFFGTPQHISQGYLNFALEISTEIIEKFGSIFEPIENLNLVSVPGIFVNDTSAYGLILFDENNIIYHEDLLPANKKDKIYYQIAFAIAQQYFGNMITTASWNSSFITEGLASFYGYFISLDESVEHENHIMETFTVEILQNAFEIDSSLLAEPLMTSKLIPADEFNSFTRSKAFCVMRMMESVIGSETFTKGVKNLLSNYKNDSLSVEKFYDELQAAVDVDEKNIDVRYFQPWIEQSGFPLINVEIINENNLKISQQKFGNETGEILWKIPLTYMSSDNELHITWLNDAEITIEMPTDDWILFNINRNVYCRVNYDSTLWNFFINELTTGDKNKIPINNRAALIDDAFSLALYEKISYSTALSLLSYISNENNLIPWKIVHEELKFLDAMLFRSQIYQKFSQFVVDLVSPFLPNILSSDDHNLKSIILFWACQMRMEVCTTLVTNLTPQYLNNPTSFQPNDRKIILCDAVKLVNEKSNFDEMVSLMLSIDGDKSDWISGLSCIEEGYWLSEFLFLAYNKELNLTASDRRHILIHSLKNHKYGTMAGVGLLAAKTCLLSEGEIQYILEEVVKRFWDGNLLTAFNRTDVDHIENYVNLAKDRLEWLDRNIAEIETWLDSWHETTTTTDLTTETTLSTTEDLATTDETTTIGSASLIIINSPIIVLMIYGAINV